MLRGKKIKAAILFMAVTLLIALNTVFADNGIEISVINAEKNTRELVFTEANKIPHNVSVKIKKDDEIIFADQKVSDEEGKTIFTFTVNGKKPSGIYEGLVKSERRSDAEEFTFYHVDDTDKEKIIKELLGTAQENVPAFLTKYTTEIPVFQLRSANDEYIEEVADILYENIKNSDDMEFPELLSMLSVSEALYEINKSTDIEQINTAITNNAKYLDIKLNDDYTKHYQAICNKLLGFISSGSGLTDYADFCKKYTEVLVLETVNSTLTTSQMTKVIEEYAEFIGIDLDDYNKQDKDRINRVLIGKSFRTTTAICEAYENGKVSDSDESPSKVTGGGGGGGGGAIVGSSGYTVPAEKPSAAPEALFTDLSGFEWASEAIESLAKREIVSGTAYKTFSPASEIKREEFVKMLVLSFDLYDEEAQCEFEDISAGEWYYPYVASALKAGVVNGISDELFGLGENITREQMAAMVYRIMKQQGNAPEAAEPDFNDTLSISEYAVEAVGALSGAKILNGYEDGNFNPSQTCRRAEAAKVLYGILK